MAASAFSTDIITEDDLGRVMRKLGGRHDPGGWHLRSGESHVIAELASDEIEFMPEEMLRDAAVVLDGVPSTRIALMYSRLARKEQNEVLARALCVALAEQWPVALTLHDGTTARVYPPGHRV